METVERKVGGGGIVEQRIERSQRRLTQERSYRDGSRRVVEGCVDADSKEGCKCSGTENGDKRPGATIKVREEKRAWDKQESWKSNAIKES